MRLNYKFTTFKFIIMGLMANFYSWRLGAYVISLEEKGKCHLDLS